MNGAGRLLHAIHARYAPVDERVSEILAHIARDCRELDPHARNEGNERQVEEFITWLKGHVPGRTYEVTAASRAAPGARARSDAPCVVIERQRLSKWAVRTTRWNYLFTVPGDSAEQVVLVAHYDTWRGPGADDNTTGEEIVKQYLLADLRATRRPALTHVYFLAGSEECGLVGLFSQVLLALGLFAGNFALTYRDWAMLAVAVAMLPLASYRFGVSGSREYVRTLSADELAQIRAVVSVDSVGEGRLYIPRETMGADFIRVLIPFGDYDSLNDLLEEAAHLHGIKYNNFLAGGTTDHVSYLEVNNGLVARALELLGRAPRRRIPASALVAMTPGKASPIVFGGKIHTPKDTPDRVFRPPLTEALLVLDYLFHRVEGGARLSHPRELDEFHYARLFRVGTEHVVALKDAVEPNRRNINAVYRARVTRQGGTTVAELGEILDWGVETRLPREAREACAPLEPVAEEVEALEVVAGDTHVHFAPHGSAFDHVRRWFHEATAFGQHVVRRFLFVTFFAIAWALAQVMAWLLDRTFDLWPAFALWVADHVGITLTAIIVLEVAILLHLMARRIPAWIDNGYHHENRADNLGSLKRIGALQPYA